ncbi:MAG: hypothetical protein LBC74_13015 [Planctomycetaceae bacterium]|nr:hypothetical protein [Planctomycetaceae bacterium]
MTDIKTFTPCENINLQYEVKNVNSKPQIYGHNSIGILPSSQIIISSSFIDRIPPLRYGVKRENKLQHSSYYTITLEPNKTYIRNCEVLNRCFDFSMEGKYQISVSRNTKFNNIKKEFDIVTSNLLSVYVENIQPLSKMISSNLPRIYSKPSYGISFSFVSDKSHYENYGPVYLKIASKNVSNDPLSMIAARNIFDVYELTLFTPGGNLDFCKPAAKDKSDVQKAAHTLYGKKTTFNIADLKKENRNYIKINSNKN